eukprot:TRINITY_DN600_c0_g1_i1.p1 TRINITY_DN600_c0_g1~~TRINITY_DN600_c0_g1_i1.p1  ORF type:complete len:118 (+),score=23.22 TRINITY_DN600_c0_g1_i1:30-356(+)
MPAKETKSKAQKQLAAQSSGKSGKKKKWSKGKAKEKLNNLVVFDKITYEKLLKEVPKYQLITPSIVSERMRVTGSLAVRGIRDLHSKGLIRQVAAGTKQLVYTRASKE